MGYKGRKVYSGAEQRDEQLLKKLADREDNDGNKAKYKDKDTGKTNVSSSKHKYDNKKTNIVPGKTKEGRNKQNNKKRKTNTQLKINTWNISTMSSPGKMQKIATEFERYKIDIAAVQETRWQGLEEIKKNNFILRYMYK